MNYDNLYLREYKEKASEAYRKREDGMLAYVAEEAANMFLENYSYYKFSREHFGWYYSVDIDTLAKILSMDRDVIYTLKYGFNETILEITNELALTYYNAYKAFDASAKEFIKTTTMNYSESGLEYFMGQIDEAYYFGNHYTFAFLVKEAIIRFYFNLNELGYSEIKLTDDVDTLAEILKLDKAVLDTLKYITTTLKLSVSDGQATKYYTAFMAFADAVDKFVSETLLPCITMVAHQTAVIEALNNKPVIPTARESLAHIIKDNGIVGGFSNQDERESLANCIGLDTHILDTLAQNPEEPTFEYCNAYITFNERVQNYLRLKEV